MARSDHAAHLIDMSSAEAAKATRAESPVQSKLSLARKAFLEAREHKRQQDRHRRRARSAMARYETLRTELESLGITVILEPSPSPEGGPSERDGNEGSTA